MLPFFNSFCQASNAIQIKIKYYTDKQHLLNKK